MNNRSPIQRSISFVLVGMIGLFALTSLGNISDFVRQYHHGWTGWTLGAGFGVTVFICAYLAATAKRRSTRVWSLLVGGIFGLASGFFQVGLYIDGGAPVHVAVLLSFVPIIVGEVGLALVESSYSHENMLTEADAERAEVARLNMFIEQMNSDHQAALNMEREQAEQRDREHNEHVQAVRNEHAERLEQMQNVHALQVENEQRERSRIEDELTTLREQFTQLASCVNTAEHVQRTTKRTSRPKKKEPVAKVDPGHVHLYFVNNPDATVRQAADDLGYSIGSITKYKPSVHANGNGAHG